MTDESGEKKKSFVEREEKILDFWRREQIFTETVDREAPEGDFVFWEGPPTANGRPGIHHLFARTFKDAIPRYKTMRGYRVSRKAGWDTHGLPVELEVEKALKISGKKQIENIVPGDARASITEFNRRSKASVWKYQEEWERLTERIGFWIDLGRPYITYDASYIETLWWILSRVDARGLLTKGFKSVPYCPRCGTTLSSHEVAQGYDEADDPSIFVLFEHKTEDRRQPPRQSAGGPATAEKTGDRSAFLVWTTTPWTLPGNAALAVDPKELYVEVAIRNTQYAIQKVILAKKRLEVLEGNYQVIRTIKGSDLVGQSYEPLYRQTDDPKAYQVYAAEFVSMADGTGIVHIAPAFGADDFELGQTVGLPMLRTIDEAGLMTAPDAPGAGKFVKDADPDVVVDLQQRGLLFRAERITHTYPFCWRCQTPLIYLARDSWYIRMSTLRDELLARNARIDWIPSHLRDGRFGEWLREVKDWAISRDRYWGTPLPIWVCERCEQYRVAAGLDEFRAQIEQRNTFLFLRHGEAEKDLGHLMDYDAAGSPMTERGRAGIRALAATLKTRGITKIIASPVVRTQETATIIARELGLSIETDERLREMDFGDFRGRSVAEWKASMPLPEDRWLRGATGGENWFQVQRRMVDAVAELNSRHQSETILVVSHGDPLYVLLLRLAGVTDLVGQDSPVPYPEEARPIEAVVNLFDLHRPYVDDLTLTCSCGGVMRRISQVLDVWFDSGAMPFAQWGWRGEGPIGPSRNIEISKYRNSAPETQQYPADYIAEGVDQTRGWFYTLLAIGTLLASDLPAEVAAEPAYRHVVSFGLLLDEAGQKMSKSRGNVIDPWQLINEYGADAVRLHLMTISRPGDEKRFGLKGVGETLRRSLMLLDNIWKYSETYRSQTQDSRFKIQDSHRALDAWLDARLHEVTSTVTTAYEAFDLFTAGRTLLTWIDELSTWYLRRSRGRTDPAFFDHLDRAMRTTALLLAPICPFFTDDLWQRLRAETDPRSVHLASWPPVAETTADESEIIAHMIRVRQLVELGHADRNAKGIKLRQPLASVTITGLKTLPVDLQAVLAEELNVKTVVFEAREDLGAVVDPKLTPELRREGLERELLRQIQALRKAGGLAIGQTATLSWSTDDPDLRVILGDSDFATKLRTTELREQAAPTSEIKPIQIGDKRVILWLA